MAVLSAAGLALLLGARHGLDADHLAAIDGLSRLGASANRPWLSRWSGMLFSVGHGAVVLAAALLLRGTETRLPAWLDVLGSAVSIGLLTILGLLNLTQALSRQRPGQGRWAVSWAARLPILGGVGGALWTGAVFALSFDTLTIAAWFGLAGGSGAGAGNVSALAGAFVLGMVACDGANGLLIAHLIARSQDFAIGARRLFSALVACIALGVAGIELSRLGPARGSGWSETSGLWLSATILGLLVASFLVLRRTTLRNSR